MPRARIGAARRRKHKKIMKAARGFYGASSRRYNLAKQATFRAGVYATRDRKTRKRDFRRLWVTRISAACRQRGVRYSELMSGLFHADIQLNRKMLADLAVSDPTAFDAVFGQAMAAGRQAAGAAG